MGEVLMGTNYYLYRKPDCECCGRNDPPLHIGKSSGGWVFSLHVIPEEGINTLSDWAREFSSASAVIKDECDSLISAEEMLDIIKNRSPFGIDRKPLRRHEIDGRWCIGHGEGTWDYMPGEFS